jgi:hypothetical protein
MFEFPDDQSVHRLNLIAGLVLMKATVKASVSFV